LASAVSRVPGTSLHRQLFTVLRDQITRGVYAPGAMIPKEEALCTNFGVSRITVRRAIADLETEGLLRKRPGLGTFVTDKLPPMREAASLGLLDSLRKVADETTAEVLTLETVIPPLNIAHQLGLASETKAVHVIRLRRMNGVAVMITDSWIPEKFGRDITRQKLDSSALYEILIAQGIAFERVVQEITAIAATPSIAQLLTTQTGMPLVQLTRILYDTNRSPVQHLAAIFSPARSRFLMDVSIDDVNTSAAGTIIHDV
jgi:GntR family transcriptional regulator